MIWLGLCKRKLHIIGRMIPLTKKRANEHGCQDGKCRTGVMYCQSILLTRTAFPRRCLFPHCMVLVSAAHSRYLQDLKSGRFLQHCRCHCHLCKYLLFCQLASLLRKSSQACSISSFSAARASSLAMGISFYTLGPWGETE